ncbi:hypothetical protein GEV39_18210 [Pseudomonas sp. NY5710]|uniref:hypothetical protein n=1 Tax=Pseudomonas sp. NY5710 TaxID=2662033 RepID=UPI001570B2A4|nr:hypothetical protein [Pseudomonas sp. NY5710]QKL03186.1 hypothetical protein GEV39_18210 [Pseudomonas sp. NY5710]
MHEVDSPDYNKARGFLIGFSLLVLLLWFFGIDIAKLKIMGSQLELHRNGEYVWLVVASINAYLLLRFYQRLPERALKPDASMHKVVDECLISMCKRLYKRDANRFAQKALEEDEGVPVKILRLRMGGLLSYHEEIERVQSDQCGAKHPWNYSYPERAELSYSLIKVYIRRGEQVTSHGGRRYIVTPHRVIYSLIFMYAFFKGLLGKPWFTDNVIPLMLGILGVSVALSQWLNVWFS